MNKSIYTFLLAACCLTACDDGPIYPETTTSAEGKTVVMEGQFTGLNGWPGNYRVSIAGFENADDEYATVSKVITASDIKDGKLSVELSGLQGNITVVRLCILDRLRRHVVTINEADISKSPEVITIDLGNVDASMYNIIQQQFFDKRCTSCHRDSREAFAGLDLTDGNSYQALVGVPSKRVADKLLVEPNNASESVLHKVINEEFVEGVAMKHYDITQKEDRQIMLPLIDAWINNGARED